MPLPPAPTKRAALLTPEAFDAPAQSPSRASRKAKSSFEPEVLAQQPQARDMFEHGGGGGGTAPARVEPPKPRAVPERQKRSRPTGPTKLFVLDTNVLLHDPMCLFHFQEHDIFLPMIVLEELDGHKKGMTEVARNARQTSRMLDALAGTQARVTSAPVASCFSRPSR
jgi:PhoH-like ATPase